MEPAKPETVQRNSLASFPGPLPGGKNVCLNRSVRIARLLIFVLTEALYSSLRVYLQLYLANLPNILYLEPTPFVPEQFLDDVAAEEAAIAEETAEIEAELDAIDEETDPDGYAAARKRRDDALASAKAKQEENLDLRNLKVDNTIRWRYENGGDSGTSNLLYASLNRIQLFAFMQKKESNARVLRWSDGSLSLLVGREFFQMNTATAPPRQTLVVSHPSEAVLQTQAVLTQNLNFSLYDTNQATHKKLTMAIAQKHRKSTRTVFYEARGSDRKLIDPELEKLEMEKMEMAKARDQRKLAQKQDKVASKYRSRTKRGTYDDFSDEEDFAGRRGSAREMDAYDDDDGFIEKTDEEDSDDAEEIRRRERIQRAKRASSPQASSRRLSRSPSPMGSGSDEEEEERRRKRRKEKKRSKKSKRERSGSLSGSGSEGGGGKRKRHQDGDDDGEDGGGRGGRVDSGDEVQARLTLKAVVPGGGVHDLSFAPRSNAKQEKRLKLKMKDLDDKGVFTLSRHTILFLFLRDQKPELFKIQQQISHGKTKMATAEKNLQKAEKEHGKEAQVLESLLQQKAEVQKTLKLLEGASRQISLDVVQSIRKRSAGKKGPNLGEADLAEYYQK
ncbi:Leo1-like protein-domain-containing protein [Blyttiomyces helicus]|uniref:Leo1-like protein-domain-containing protein n=1 Tax=Blyttiomyces helicus TaxID=388810 RepID=A0A4P9W7Z0_9FUNG|nr:Leo1-like protein-domain-containing protein [Blyttiomyces helicus]|eukprot:RKO88212.1 Leo1-like protein-domain-containing protein [Blyttiomyces helicus]